MKLSKERTKVIHVPNDPDSGTVTIKNLGKETIARIEGDYMVVTDRGVELRNFAEREATLAKECIKDWANLYDADGNPLKCTIKNLELASQFAIEVDEGDNKRFFEWINEEREKFAEEVDNEEKAASKN